jgi:hypothetical protein
MLYTRVLKLLYARERMRASVAGNLSRFVNRSPENLSLVEFIAA